MEQGSLLDPVPGFLPVKTDYGEVGRGASRAHWALVENGSEYIIKGPAFVPDQPTVAANEWIAAKLADALGLPLLDSRIVTMGGECFFASTWMTKGTFAPGIDAQLFGRCTNKDRAYELVVFDAWCLNNDRHHENLVVRLPRKSGDPHLLVLNDHSHLLICPGNPQTPEQLVAQLDAGPCVRLPFISESIVNEARSDRAIQAIEAVPGDVIRGAIGITPESLLPQPYRDAYQDFLLQRQTRLRSVFAGHRSAFPNLKV